MDLVALAAGTNRQVIFRGEYINLKRGQLIMSERFLAARWKWDRGTVHRFLAFCLDERMIRYHRKNHRISIVTILNYRIYNPSKRTNATTESTTDATTDPTTTKKDIKKDIKNKEKPLLVRKIKKEYFELVDLLNEKMLENDPKAKIADTEDRRSQWANDFRLLIEQDQREIEEAREVLTWCQEDSFWQGNILSASKFRKQYGQLKLKKDRDRPKRKTDAEVLAEREAYGKQKEKEDRGRRKTRV